MGGHRRSVRGRVQQSEVESENHLTGVGRGTRRIIVSWCEGVTVGYNRGIDFIRWYWYRSRVFSEFI